MHKNTQIKNFIRGQDGGAFEWFIIVAAVVGIATASISRLIETGSSLSEVPYKLVHNIPMHGSIQEYGYQTTGYRETPDGWTPVTCENIPKSGNQCKGQTGNPTLEHIKNGHNGLENPNSQYSYDLRGMNGFNATHGLKKTFKLQPGTYRFHFSAASQSPNLPGLGVRIKLNGAFIDPNDKTYGTFRRIPADGKMRDHYVEFTIANESENEIYIRSMNAGQGEDGARVSGLNLVKVS